MKTAYSYKRWSDKIQTDGDSFTRQTESAKRWMKEHGAAYVLSAETFTDAGKSGYKGKHIAKDENGVAKGELARFIQCVEQGKIASDSILLIDEISRFSRLRLSDAVPLFMSVINSGIGLVFTGGYDKRIITRELIDNDSYLLPSIVTDLFRANRESEEKGRKIRLAKQTMLAEIKAGVVYRNNLPKFFTFVSDNPANPKCRTGKYVHNKLTERLQELIEMFLAGKAMYSIAADFNNRGYKTFKGGEWSGNGINKVLRNRILMGEYKGVKNYVKPVVDESTFNKIQIILNRNTYNKGKKGELVNIFRGICFCECGHAMSIMSTEFKGQKYTYLRCASLTRGKIGCPYKSSISLPQMELDFILKFLAKDPWKLVNGEDNAEIKALQKQITAKTALLNQLTEDIERIFEMTRGLEIAEGKARLAKLTLERDEVKNELDTLNLKVSEIQDAPASKSELLKTLFTVSNGDGKPMLKGEGVAIELKHKTNGKEWTEIVVTDEQDAPWFHAYQALQDNEWREKLRTVLPSLIGKIVVNTKKGQFFVHNRMGKVKYQSTPQVRKYNSSDRWVKGVQDYWANKRKAKAQ